jgi:hypothetical protein
MATMANTVMSELSIEDVLSEQGSALPQRALMRVCKKKHHYPSNSNSTTQVNYGSGSNSNSTTQVNFGDGSNSNSTTQVNYGDGSNSNSTTQVNF